VRFRKKELKQCPRCGEYNGDFYVGWWDRRMAFPLRDPYTEVQCVCTGPVCPDCREHYHRPGTYCYAPLKYPWCNGPLNVPGFSALAHSQRCKGRKR
jgi:hypothetical protein